MNLNVAKFFTENAFVAILVKDEGSFLRLKSVCWKIMNDIFPTKSNLVGVQSNFMCVFCEKHKETTTHLIWQCPITRKQPFNDVVFEVEYQCCLEF